MSLVVLLCSLFLVIVILRLDVHGLCAALSKRGWITVNMPDETVQLINRKKPWTERITFVVHFGLGEVFDSKKSEGQITLKRRKEGSIYQRKRDRRRIKEERKGERENA